MFLSKSYYFNYLQKYKLHIKCIKKIKKSNQQRRSWRSVSVMPRWCTVRKRQIFWQIWQARFSSSALQCTLQWQAIYFIVSMHWMGNNLTVYSCIDRRKIIKFKKKKYHHHLFHKFILLCSYCYNLYLLFFLNFLILV